MAYSLTFIINKQQYIKCNNFYVITSFPTNNCLSWKRKFDPLENQAKCDEIKVGNKQNQTKIIAIIIKF